MSWEPREGTKIAVLLTAMEADRASRPIWTQTDAASAMGVPRALVPNYIAAACNAERLFRRTLANGGGIELSLQRFPAHAPAPLAAAGLKIPTFGKGAAGAAADAVAEPRKDRYVPPQMTAPRAGSDVRMPARAPGTPPAPAGSGQRVSTPAPAPTVQILGCAVGDNRPRSSCKHARCGDADVCWNPPQRFAAPTPAPTPAPEVDPRFAAAHYEHDLYVGERPGDGMVAAPPAPPAPAPITADALQETEEEEEAIEPDAFLSARTGEYILVGLEPDDEGRITIPADLVALMKRQLAWSPAR